MWPCVLVFFSSIIVTVIFLPSYFYLILYATEIPLLFITWYGLKLSFPEKLPIEVTLAILFYGFTIVTSFVLSFIGEVLRVPTSSTLLWIAVALIFFFASTYAPFCTLQMSWRCWSRNEGRRRFLQYHRPQCAT